MLSFEIRSEIKFWFDLIDLIRSNTHDQNLSQVEHTTKVFLRSNTRPKSSSGWTHDQTVPQVEQTTSKCSSDWKIQLNHVLVCIIRTYPHQRAHPFFSFSLNMLEMLKYYRKVKKKMNKALSGLLVYRTIMPLAKRSPSNFFEHSPAMFWHYPPIMTSRRKGFIY